VGIPEGLIAGSVLILAARYRLLRHLACGHLIKIREIISQDNWPYLDGFVDLSKESGGIARAVSSSAPAVNGAPPSPHRLRVGDWQALFFIEGKAVKVTSIRRRESAYDGPGRGARTRAATQFLICAVSRSAKRGTALDKQRVFAMPFSTVYPLYLAKAKRKGRTRAELDQIICWLTGYTPSSLRQQIARQSDFAAFFADAPALNPKRKLIKGVVCGVRVEEVKDPLMKKIRYLDKLVDELAQGRAMEKILRH
jgi:hypothetical protein